MRKSSRLGLLMAVIGVAFSCMPEKAFTADGSGEGYITQLYVNGAGDMVRINFSLPIKNPDGCQAGEMYVRELPNTAGASRYLATLVTAYMQKKRVGFWIAGCTTNQWWGATRPQLFDIYIVGD